MSAKTCQFPRGLRCCLSLSSPAGSPWPVACSRPDSCGHRARLGKQDNQYATAGYPQIRLVALVACGTRAIIDAVFGPTAGGEQVYLPRLLRSLHEGMIVLLDRGLSSAALLAAVT